MKTSKVLIILNAVLLMRTSMFARFRRIDGVFLNKSTTYFRPTIMTVEQFQTELAPILLTSRAIKLIFHLTLLINSPIRTNGLLPQSVGGSRLASPRCRGGGQRGSRGTALTWARVSTTAPHVEHDRTNKSICRAFLSNTFTESIHKKNQSLCVNWK